MKVQTQSTISLLVGFAVMFGVVGTSYAMPITELFDFVNQRDEVEWRDLNENVVALEGSEENLNVIRTRSMNIPTGLPRMGDFYGEPLYMRAKTSGSGESYGILGRKILRLPEKLYLQFQGSAEFLAGREDGIIVGLQVETWSDTSNQWVQKRIFTGVENTRGSATRRFVSFISDLSQWSGQEVRLSLVMKINPTFLMVNDERLVRPEEIAIQWISAEIVSSRIKVVLGEPERVDLFRTRGGKIDRGVSHSLIPSATISGSTSNLELVMEGNSSGGHGCMKNPSDAPLASLYLPAADGYNSRFVCYFTCILNEDNEPHGLQHGPDSPEGVYGASTRLVDFLLSSGNNMYSASVNEITSAVHIDNGTAVAVLSPSGDASLDFDDHYASITTAAYDTLDDINNTPVIHAFFHAEDHFQFDGGRSDDHNRRKDGATPIMASIGYARSTPTDNNFGRSFTKTYSTSGKPIISYQLSEEQVIMPTNSTIYDVTPTAVWGCASPSLYADSNFYYLTYHTLSWNKSISSASRNTAIISLARASKNKINNYNISSSTNPWNKFKEVNTAVWDASDNFTEPGLEGEFSGLWNVKKENDKRTDQPSNPTEWRAFPKVSYNEFLYNAQNFDRHMLMFTHGPNGFYMHTATNLTDWDGGLCIQMANNEYYPSLIGSQGYDAHTTEYNKLYYFKHNSDNTGDLYRCNANLIIIP